jgi:hypothetical protein
MSSIGAHSFSSGSSCSTRTAYASIGSLIFVLYLYVDIELENKPANLLKHALIRVEPIVGRRPDL